MTASNLNASNLNASNLNGSEVARLSDAERTAKAAAGQHDGRLRVRTAGEDKLPRGCDLPRGGRSISKRG